MSARRSWPAPGWTWDSVLETYVPSHDAPLIAARLELEARRLEARERDLLRENEGLRAARGLEPGPSPWERTP